MVLEVMVNLESPQSWPARNGKPGGSCLDIHVIDRSLPAQYRFSGMYTYRCTQEERDKWEGKLVDRFVRLGVREVMVGQRGPIFRGSIVEVRDMGNGGSTAAEPAVKAK